MPARTNLPLTPENVPEPPPPPAQGSAKKIIGAVLLAVVIGLVIQQFWPSDEAEIRETLVDLAATLEKQPQAAVLALAGKIGSMQKLFSKECVVEPGRPLPAMKGRAQVVETFKYAWSSVAEFHIRFTARDIAIDGDHASAKVTASYRVSKGSQDDIKDRALAFEWQRVEGEWMISKVTVLAEESD